MSRLAAALGDPQVRNRGTIGGAAANNDPTGDYPAALLGLGARIVTDRRTIEAEAYFSGMVEVTAPPSNAASTRRP